MAAKRVSKPRNTTSPERPARTRRSGRLQFPALELRDLRRMAGMTQVELAAALESAQSLVSVAERRDDHLVSTLRDYVEALGGELDVVARFGDKSIRLRGV